MESRANKRKSVARDKAQNLETGHAAVQDVFKESRQRIKQKKPTRLTFPFFPSFTSSPFKPLTSMFYWSSCLSFSLSSSAWLTFVSQTFDTEMTPLLLPLSRLSST